MENPFDQFLPADAPIRVNTNEAMGAGGTMMMFIQQGGRPQVHPCRDAIINAAPAGNRVAAQTAVPLLLDQGTVHGFSDAQMAYVFATVEHESGFAPIPEWWNPGRGRGQVPNQLNYDAPGNHLGNIPGRGDGQYFRGRGYVQLTGRTNYTS